MSAAPPAVVERDPERLLKFKECCDLLLAGGYFRARISSLSPFDRVVGGIAWSLTSAGHDTGGIDIIFTENASIGQRIRLSDALVKGLVAAQCPHPLQSHQIQGLDYVHLFPVIQWLVRSVLEVRRLTGDLTRLQSVRQFQCAHRPLFAPTQESTEKFLATINTTYRPHRLYKPKSGANFGTIDRRIDATLLEFGEKIQRQVKIDEKAEHREKSSKISASKERVTAMLGQPSASQSQAQSLDQSSALYSELAAQLSDSANVSRVSGASVGAIVSLHSDAIKRAIEDYNDAKKRSEEDRDQWLMQGKRGAEIQHAKQMDAINKRIAAINDTVDAKHAAHTDLTSRLAELSTAIQSQRQYIERCHRESKKLDVIENENQNSDLLNRIKVLVNTNEKLQTQRQQFYDSNQAQYQSLVSEIQSLESQYNDANNIDIARIQQIEKVFDSDSSKLAKLRIILASRNQLLNKLYRAIDDRPSRAELLQYEKRFSELSSLVHEKLSETRKYYSLYNTLSDSLTVMQGEKSLFEELINSYPNATKSKAGKQQLFEKLNVILDGIRSQRESKNGTLLQSIKEQEGLQFKHSALIEKQRAYAKLVREFKEEGDINDQLTQQLSQ